METLTLSEHHANQLVTIIKKEVPSATIYIIPFQNYTLQKNVFSVNIDAGMPFNYCVLVLTPKNSQILAHRLYNEIRERIDDLINISFLVHNVSSLATKQANQQRFFDFVFRHGQRIHLDKLAPPYLLCNSVPVRNLEEDRKFWFKCVMVAQFNINAAANHPHTNVGLCKIALLNTACVHLAHGLIRIFIEYTPNDYGLKYLLILCGCFTTIPQEIFGSPSPLIVKRFKMLCAPPVMLNHWLKLDASDDDVAWLLDATLQFLSLSQELVNQKLNLTNT